MGHSLLIPRGPMKGIRRSIPSLFMQLLMQNFAPYKSKILAGYCSPAKKIAVKSRIFRTCSLYNARTEETLR